MLRVHQSRIRRESGKDRRGQPNIISLRQGQERPHRYEVARLSPAAPIERKKAPQRLSALRGFPPGLDGGGGEPFPAAFAVLLALLL